MNRGISQWERERHKVLMAWWPRWQLVKERDSRLISRFVILPHCCLYSMLSHLFFCLLPLAHAFLVYYPSFPTLSPPFLSSLSLPPIPFYSSLTAILFLRHLCLCHVPLYPLFRLNALFSLNALFFLTFSLHPSRWPRVTPGRIITLGWNISSVAPYSALSARIIHLWSIPFCGEPSSYSPVMIGVLATLCICTVI